VGRRLHAACALGLGLGFTTACSIDDRVLEVGPADAADAGETTDAADAHAPGDAMTPEDAPGEAAATIDAAPDAPLEAAAGDGGGPCTAADAAACGCDAYHPLTNGYCVARFVPEIIPGANLLAVTGTSASDVYAIDFTHVYHSTGTGKWTVAFTVPDSGDFSYQSLSAIWADTSNPGTVLLAGPMGSIVDTTDGATWTQRADPTTFGANYDVITGIPGNYAFALGDPYAYATHTLAGWAGLGMTALSESLLSAATYDTGNVTLLAGGSAGNIYSFNSSQQFVSTFSTGWTSVSSMWASSDGAAIYAVGPGGGVASATSCPATGSPSAPICNWKAETSGTKEGLAGVFGVPSGSGKYTLFAAGNSGVLLTSTSGSGTWSTVPTNSTDNLAGVWAASPSNVFLVTGGNTVLHFMGP
jgi:hypothetical protein